MSELKILIVDDNVDDRNRLQSFLKTEPPCIIFEAESGEEGLELIKTEKIDCVLLDYHLPDLDGIEFTKRLYKTQSPLPAVIMLTGHGSEDVAVEVMKFGIQDYLVKRRELSREAVRRSIFNAVEKSTLEAKLEKERLRNKLELEQARITQTALLPRKTPTLNDLHISIKYLPTTSVGGDFYDFFELKGGKVGIIVADVSGHDVSAALVSFMVSGLFKTFAPEIESPQSLLLKINELLFNKIPEGMFVSVFYGIYDSTTQSLIYSSGGHPPALLLNTGWKLRHLSSEGTMLGLFGNDVYKITEKQIALNPRDKLLIYTDGLSEVANPTGELFGILRIENFLSEHTHLEGKFFLNALCDAVLSYSQKTSFEDDITLVLLEAVESRI